MRRVAPQMGDSRTHGIASPTESAPAQAKSEAASQNDAQAANTLGHKSARQSDADLRLLENNAPSYFLADESKPRKENNGGVGIARYGFPT